MPNLEAILRRTDYLARAFFMVAVTALGVLFLLTFSDIAARFLFNAAVWGTVEISEYLLVVIAFLALGFSQLTGTHVRVDILVSRLPVRLQTSLNILGLLASMAFFAIMMQELAERAYILWQGGVLLSTTTVRLPVWWRSAIAAVGCAVLILSLLTQLVHNIIGMITGKVVGFVTWTR